MLKEITDAQTTPNQSASFDTWVAISGFAPGEPWRAIKP